MQAPSCPGKPAARVVFVQTDRSTGNQVVAYHRAADGTLTPAGTYATGGLGGQLSGSVVDHLASCPEHGRGRGGRPGHLAWHAARHRRVRGAVLGPDLAVPDPGEPGPDGRGAGTPQRGDRRLGPRG
jgi:hypothetical protein